MLFLIKKAWMNRIIYSRNRNPLYDLAESYIILPGMKDLQISIYPSKTSFAGPSRKTSVNRLPL